LSTSPSTPRTCLSPVGSTSVRKSSMSRTAPQVGHRWPADVTVTIVGGAIVMVLGAAFLLVGIIVALDFGGLGTRHEQWFAYINAAPWKKAVRTDAADVQTKRAVFGCSLMAFGAITFVVGLLAALN